MDNETGQAHGKNKGEGRKKSIPLSEVPYSAVSHNIHPKDVLNPPAVFPELPSPLKTIYLIVRDMNRNRNSDGCCAIPESDCAPEHNVIEAGFKISF